MELVLFAGDNLQITERGANGTAQNIIARAFILGNKVFIRVDHPKYTADQLMRHETGHDMIAKGEIDPKDVRKRIERAFGRKKARQLAQLYIEAYAGSNLTPEEIWEEVICDSLADMNVFAGDYREIPARQLLTETKKVAAEGQTESTRGPPSTEGKASRDLELRGEPKNKPQSAAEWSAFNRSFANKTSNMKPGDTHMVEITTASHVYFVDADGYMQGFAEKKVPIRHRNKLEEFRRLYRNVNEVRGNLDSLLESYRDERRGLGGRDDIAGNHGAAGYAGRISGIQQKRDESGRTEGDGSYFEGDNLNDQAPPGALVYDGEGHSFEMTDDGGRRYFSRELNTDYAPLSTPRWNASLTA